MLATGLILGHQLGATAYTTSMASTEALKEAWQRHRFFEALARVFLANQPALFVIDDIQWCDPESLEWIAYLMRFDPKANFLFVTSFQQRPLEPDHPLASLFQGLKHNEQLVEIPLKSLSETETFQLAKDTAGHRFESNHLSSLYQHTPRFEYRQAYHSLTGKQLPEPTPLPEYPQDIPQDEASLRDLIARAGQIETHQQAFQAPPQI